MNNKSTIQLDEEIQQNINSLAENFAIELSENSMPDPLHPPNFRKKQIQLEIQAKLLQFFGIIVNGVMELIFTLYQLSQNEPELYSTEIQTQLDQISIQLGSIEEDTNKTPKELCGITEETFKAFDKAVVYLFNNQEYEKASAVYAFLAFLDPADPFYWIGLGDSEFFLKHFDKALEAYESAILLAPEYVPFYFYCAHCYLELNQTDKAIDIVNKTLEMTKNNSSLPEWKEQAEQLRLYMSEPHQKEGIGG